MENEYINIKEISEILGIQMQSVRVVMKDIPMYRITRKVALWKRADFLKMVKDKKVAVKKL